MIGGEDATHPYAPTIRDVEWILRLIRLRWPEAVVADDKHQLAVTPTIPCAWHIAHDQRVFDLLEAEGVTDAVEPLFFSVYVETDAIHFVFGIDEHCSGAVLVREILAGLDEARTSGSQ